MVKLPRLVIFSLFACGIAACASGNAVFRDRPVPTVSLSAPAPLPYPAAAVQAAGPEEAFKKAITAYKNEDWEGALYISAEIARAFPETAWYKRSLFLEEQAFIKLDRPSEADAAMLSVVAAYPEVADYGLFILAEYHLSKERYSEAAALYEQLGDRYSESLLMPRSALRRAQALFHSGAFAPAAELFERFIHDYPQSEQCPEACMGLGKALTAQSDIAGGVRAFRDVLIKYPGSSAEPSAEAALGLLREGGTAVPELTSGELYERGRNLLHENRFKKAAETFTKLLEADPRYSNRPEVMLRTGVALFQSGRRADAAALLEKMVKENRRDPRVPEALYWTARSLSKQGETEKAVKIFGKLLNSYPDSEWTDDALFISGNIYRDASETKKANVFYERLAKDHPGSKYADSAMWWLAWGYFRLGEYTTAVQKLEDLAGRYPKSPLANQARYWQGRASEKTGDREHALAYYRKVVKQAPYSYYGYRGSERLAQLNTSSPATLTADLIVDEHSICSEETCTEEPLIPNEFEDAAPVWTAEALQTLTEEPSFIKSRELLYLNMKKEAAAELWPLQDRLPKKKGALLGLSKTFFELGDYYRSLLLVLRNYEHYLDGDGAKTPEDLWFLAYPQGYWDSIVSYSRKYGQDPYFIAAIIREESQFHSEALSPVGARGLMQVMPSTGESIARAIHLPRFDPGRLYDSDTAINLGTWYIGSLMKRFKGDPFLVAAAYNAGPEAVTAWLGRGRSDRDEFVESIPYLETRGYVKKVMRNYAEYKRIYSKAAKPLAPVEAGNAEVKATPLIKTEAVAASKSLDSGQETGGSSQETEKPGYGAGSTQ